MNLRIKKLFFSNHFATKKGFTLIELLIVIGIISILAAIVIVAINPARQFASARNSQRWSDVNAILNAIGQYVVDNNGVDTSLGFDSSEVTYQMLGTETGSICNYECDDVSVSNMVTTCLNWTNLLAPTYIAQIPKDPKEGMDLITYYAVNKLPGNRYSVKACKPENNDHISVKR